MATIKILLKSTPSKDGQYPVILRIIKDRKIKKIYLGMYCTRKDWDEVNFQFKKSHTNYIQRNRVLLKMKAKALKIIDDFNLQGEDFTLKQFEDKFRGKDPNRVTVLEFWEEKIEDLIKAGRIGNSKVHRDTKNSFFKFSDNNKILFREITPTLLDKYETHMRFTGSHDGGIAVRMRELRALFNEAINKGIVDYKHYPFKSYKISKLKGKGIKRALTREEIRCLENLNVTNCPHLLNTKNYFMFSYYTRGMNFHDMMKLTWNNINGDRINYIRSKTKGRFTIKIVEPVSAILNYYKVQNRFTPFVFPILLRSDLTPVQIENRKHKTLRRYNMQLKEIAKIQGINKDISSYTARHSFATNLKYSGVSTDIIGEALGHSDIKITQAYLKDFEDDVIDMAVNKLL